MLSDGESLVASLPSTSSIFSPVLPDILGDVGEVAIYKTWKIQGFPSVAVAFVEDL